jgi:hypothetical protein
MMKSEVRHYFSLFYTCPKPVSEDMTILISDKAEAHVFLSFLLIVKPTPRIKRSQFKSGQLYHHRLGQIRISSQLWRNRDVLLEINARNTFV